MSQELASSATIRGVPDLLGAAGGRGGEHRSLQLPAAAHVDRQTPKGLGIITLPFPSVTTRG